MTVKASQRMYYGMGAYSWCLVKVPGNFKYIADVSEVTTGGNLSYIQTWTFDSNTFLLTSHNEDVWPEWTNDIEISNLQGPWGQ